MNKITKIAGVLLLVAFTVAAADLARLDGYWSPGALAMAFSGLVVGVFTYFLVPLADARVRNLEELSARIAPLSRRGRYALFASVVAVALAAGAAAYWVQVWLR